MVKHIKQVLLAVWMMVFLNIAHAQQSFVDQFIVLELDLTQPDVANIWASGLQENRYWTISVGSDTSYRFVSDKKVSKEVVGRTHHALDFAAFKIQLEKWAQMNSMRDFASGRYQFKNLYIKEVSKSGIQYYHVKFEYEYWISCKG